MGGHHLLCGTVCGRAVGFVSSAEQLGDLSTLPVCLVYSHVSGGTKALALFLFTFPENPGLEMMCADINLHILHSLRFFPTLWGSYQTVFKLFCFKSVLPYKCKMVLLKGKFCKDKLYSRVRKYLKL